MTGANPPARRALITNDDGITAPGLRWLATAAIESGLEVVVAAPEREASGASAGLSAHYRAGRLEFTETTLPDLDIPAYAINASPSYIVILAALATFGPRPDVVLSGINRGANAGLAVLHSGTVGAAFTAANQGLRAMAVSLDVLSATATDPATGATLSDTLASIDDGDLHWQTATDAARQLLPVLETLPPGVILNVNVPNRRSTDLRGLTQAALAPFGQVQMAVAESGRDYVRIALEANSDRHQPGTDVALLADGHITVTPIGSIRALDIDLLV